MKKLYKVVKRVIFVFFKFTFLKRFSFYKDLPWAEEWKDFYLENRDNINGKTSLLKKGLDVNSKKEVDVVLKRYVFLLSPEKSLFANKFFTKEEISLRKKLIKERDKTKKRYPLPSDHYEDCVFFFKSGLKIIENDRIRKYLKDKIFIDGGAFIGDSASVFLDYDPKTIFAFEPNKDNFLLLRKTIEMNSFRNIVPIRLALGNRQKMAFITSMANTSHLINNRAGSKEDTINIVTLDNFLEKRKENERVGLIKLDVEGYEYEVIKGAKETIKKDKPIILCSIYHTPKDFFEIKPLLESLVKDYEFLIRKLNPFHPVYETMLIAYPQELKIRK